MKLIPLGFTNMSTYRPPKNETVVGTKVDENPLIRMWQKPSILNSNSWTSGKMATRTKRVRKAEEEVGVGWGMGW